MKLIAGFKHAGGMFTVVMLLSLVHTARPVYSHGERGAAEPIDTEAVSQWLRRNAIEIKSVQAGVGFEDMQPLKKVLKDVKVVGLGEATHGTREFFQFKHRMVEFLVKEMGFTAFAIEASYPACLNINDYVVYGKGDKSEALTGLRFWSWDTEEVMQLIDWMRAYNKDLPEAKRIKFLGYDMQHYHHAYNRLYPYLKRVAPEELGKAGVDVLPARIEIAELRRKADAERKQLQAQIQSVIQYMAVNKARFSEASSRREYEEALHCARIMGQYIDGITRNSGRDRYMAENIQYIVNSGGPETKVISWAHNGHTSLNGYGHIGLWSMGRYLQQAYGRAYYALGFAFNRGSFQAINQDSTDKDNQGLVTFHAEPAGEGTIDWYLARPGIKNYVVDFRLSNKSPQVEQWLTTSLPMKSIGATYNKQTPNSPSFLRPTALKEEFDGIVFMDVTTNSRTNPFWLGK